MRFPLAAGPAHSGCMWYKLFCSSVCLGCLSLSHAVCVEKDPYSNEKNPFGWQLSPADWDFSEQSCWKEKYAMCGGAKQSPVHIDTTECPSQTDPVELNLVYDTIGGGVVEVSSYMRSVMVEGSFGIVSINGMDHEVVQVHLMAPNLHTKSQLDAKAEMLIVHKPVGISDMERKFVIISVMIVAGNENDIFTGMGLDDSKQKEESWALEKDFNLQLNASTYVTYHGSMPVPPCWETVSWILLSQKQEASVAQIENLKDVLTEATGSTQPREARAIECNELAINTFKEDPGTQTCDVPDKLLSSQCWEAEPCGIKSPVDLDPDQGREGTAASFADMLHYKAISHVHASADRYTVDISNAASHDDFGYLLVHGKQFVAKHLSIKAISMHTHNGEHHAGELLIVHELFGDNLTSTENEKHHLIVSVPLEIGTQSPMLESLGFGTEEHQAAIRDHHGYTHAVAFDLASSLGDLLEGDWLWYSGGQVFPGSTCPVWGTRWLVSSKSMQVTLDQLNTLALDVSGMDSSRMTVNAPDTWKSSLPDYAVDKDDAPCDDEDHDVYSYDYIHCWASSSISDNMCGTGHAQSPIDIKNNDVQNTGSDIFLHRVSWKPVTNLKVEKVDATSLKVHSNQLGYAMLYSVHDEMPAFYQVTNFSLHMPSEHTIDGHQFVGELQIGHNKQYSVRNLHSDDAMVTSFLFTIGPHHNVLLDQLFHALDHGTNIETPVDLMQVFGPALEGDFYHYSGSHTTPDLACAEVVKWFIFTTPVEMSESQLEHFKEWFPSPSNNRPIQDSSHIMVAKNSFQEGTLVVADFYLDRTNTRSRTMKNQYEILLPVFGSIILGTVVMTAIFVHQDSFTKNIQAGGLTSDAPIGRPEMPHRH